jgi:probable F420-dependent oxidoreductase
LVTARRISFSINQGLEHVTRDDLVGAARDAESRGFATFTVADHFNTPMAPFTALTITAEATTNLRVAPYVLDNDFRHPSITVREVATIDELTAGRFDFGIGAGWKQPEYAEAGFTFDRPGVRIARLEEALEICDLAFTSEPVHFSGEFYSLAGLVCRPMPHQKPRPPVMIGGGSPKILGLAGRRADIVSVAVKATLQGRIDGGDVTVAATERKLGWIRDAAGDRYDNIRFNAPLMDAVVGHDRRALAQTALDEIKTDKGFLAYTAELTVDDLLESPYFLFGTVADIVEHLHACRERFGLTSWSLLGRTTADITPVIEALG